MRKAIFLTIVLALVCAPGYAASPPEDSEAEAAVRKIIEQFQEGLAEHNLAKLEPLVAADMVAFENGGRNDGWADLRDNHLAREFQQPAPPMEWNSSR